MGSKQEPPALIRGGKSSLTARVATPGLEVMAADSREALPCSRCGDE